MIGLDAGAASTDLWAEVPKMTEICSGELFRFDLALGLLCGHLDDLDGALNKYTGGRQVLPVVMSAC